MKLSDWASIGEILSSVAVVVTLLILVVGIRENTAVTTSEMTATAVAELSSFQRAVMADPELTRIYSAHISGDTTSLTALDRQRLSLMLTSMFAAFDSAYTMSRNDFIDVGLFGEGQDIVCGHYRLINTPSWQWLLDARSRSFVDYLVNSCGER